MPNIDRRTLLYFFGIASVTPLLPAQTAPSGRVLVAKPGESRFAFSTAQQAHLTPCKLTAEDSGGTARHSNSAHCPRLAPTCTYTIARTSGTTFCPVSSSSRRVPSNRLCRRAAASGCRVAFLMFGRTSVRKRPNSSSSACLEDSRSSSKRWGKKWQMSMTPRTPLKK